LYEEYCGFYEGGPQHHLTGDPKKKDFFVRNLIGDTRGLLLFQNLTGLEVHHKLVPAEIPADRVMKANHSGQAPHRVDQHGVVVMRAALSGRLTGFTCGGPSTPKNISRELIGDVSPSPMTTATR
jgi:hypothetical protein